MAKAIRKEVTDVDSAYRLIRYAHAASHFAPTGQLYAYSHRSVMYK